MKILLILLLVGCSKPVSITKVEPGQVWTYTIREDNPWGEGLIQTNIVLETKDGWVRYETNTRDGTRLVTSARVRWFRAGSKLVKE